MDAELLQNPRDKMNTEVAKFHSTKLSPSFHTMSSFFLYLNSCVYRYTWWLNDLLKIKITTIYHKTIFIYLSFKCLVIIYLTGTDMPWSDINVWVMVEWACYHPAAPLSKPAWGDLPLPLKQEHRALLRDLQQFPWPPYSGVRTVWFICAVLAVRPRPALNVKQFSCPCIPSPGVMCSPTASLCSLTC